MELNRCCRISRRRRTCWSVHSGCRVWSLGSFARRDTPVDWDEIWRLAGLPSFNVVKELDELKKEVARELNLNP